MSTITTSVGLATGIDSAAIIDALIGAERAPVVRLENRKTTLEQRQAGLQSLSAFVSTIQTTLDTLSDSSVYEDVSVSIPPDSGIVAAATSQPQAGSYSFTPVRTTSTHSSLSRGFADSDTQLVGTGTLVLRKGGGVADEVTLSELNGGQGVRAGTVRITDRSGATADVDLSAAHTVEDVLEVINAANVGVTASLGSNGFVLTDTSGGSGTLSVGDLAGGNAAADLGLTTTASGGTLTGSAVYALGSTTTLAQLNDGNAIRVVGGDDITITARDATAIGVDLSSATTLGEVVDAINNDADNGGKVTASIGDGRLILTDTTGGSGTLSVADVGDAAVTTELGLNAAAAGDTLTGERILADLGSVLLRNVNGGGGIGTPGSVSITDRSGASATVDLSAAESLSDVIDAINAAGLGVTAAVDESGLGLTLTDTTGSTASNLIVADVASGTSAADLGLVADVAATTVEGGPLDLRTVNAGTSLSAYAADGSAVSSGQFQITAADGATATITVGAGISTVGDVIDQINSASIGVTAALNATGDGFTLTDTTGGSGELSVNELNGGDTAADLGLRGTVDTSGTNPVLDARRAVVVEIDADDTLDEVVTKLNTAGAGVINASVLDDGSAFTPKRLSITAAASGAIGRFFVDDGAGLGLRTTTEGEDALLRVGGSGGPLVPDSDGTFTGLVGGLDIDVTAATGQQTTVTVTSDTGRIKSGIETVVSTYNAFVSAVSDLTRFDSETNQRGILNGDPTTLRVKSRLDDLFLKTFGTSNSTIRTLAEIGITTGQDGNLAFDSARFDTAYQADPDGVEALFTEATTGFGAVAESTLDAIVDPFDGLFKIEDDALSQTVSDLEERITDLDALLEVRRIRLVNEFAALETIVSSLQSQQTALDSLAPLAAPTSSS
ncbi:MAG: flagellar filament capping protein FliD [Planctomycetota bacterium]